MEVKDLHLSGVKLITCKKMGDDRGFFCERFRKDFFEQAGLPFDFIQDNFSRSQAKVLRGLHYQYDRPQGKLVTCLRGSITDVAVDIRAGSKTFGQHVAVELVETNPQWLWVPAGFAHGFCVNSSEGADVLYKVTEQYNPKGEEGISWDDPDLNVAWTVDEPILSAKDVRQNSWQDYKKNPRF